MSEGRILDTSRLEAAIDSPDAHRTAEMLNGRGYPVEDVPPGAASPSHTTVAQSIALESRAPLDRLFDQMEAEVDKQIKELEACKSLIRERRDRTHAHIQDTVLLSNDMAQIVLDTRARIADIKDATK